MNKNTLARLKEYKGKYPEIFAEAAQPDAILEAEAKLGCQFPEDYREFLLAFGSAIVGPYPIYGVCPAEALCEDWSVVKATYSAIERGVQVPAGGFVASEDSAGNPVVFDGRVWVRKDHEFGGQDEFSSFEEYVGYCLRGVG